MESYKEEFIKFLVKSGALAFGEFTLKSGRVAPYFINSGMFFYGDRIDKLGEYYAEAIKDNIGEEFDSIYGPAYKGIPLCVTASIALNKMGVNKAYSFNRKKVKEYGQKDNIVGMPLDSEKKIVIVDDVMTAGTSVRENIEFLKDYGSPEIKGIVIMVDRMEKGTGELSAVQDFEQNMGIKVYPIVNLNEVISVLHNNDVDGKVYINDDMKKKIDEYLEEYGAR